MKRYFIEDVKRGMSAGGVGCGPIEGSVIVTIRMNDGEKTQWLSMAEFVGVPNIYLTDKDVYEDLIKEDFDDEEFTEYIEEHFIDSLDGIKLGEEYSDIEESLAANPESPAAPLIRFLINVTRSDERKAEELIELAGGKYADELQI